MNKTHYLLENIEKRVKKFYSQRNELLKSVSKIESVSKYVFKDSSWNDV